MSFKQLLDKSLSEDVVVKHQFLIDFDPLNNIVHAFFEGRNDESFYGTFIRNFLHPDWRLKTYDCKGKRGVYYHFQSLGDRHQNHQPLLFFVDKDIDDIVPEQYLSDPRIYVTDYYSIENYLVTAEALEQIWAEIFRASSGTHLSEELQNKFSSGLLRIHELLIDFMAWVLAHRRARGRPNLDCVITASLFTINDELEVSLKYDINSLYTELDRQTKVTSTVELLASIESCKKELLAYEAKKVVRGHNELDFFVIFIKRLSALVASTTFAPKINFTIDNILHVVSPRIRIPDSLDRFLSEYVPG